MAGNLNDAAQNTHRPQINSSETLKLEEQAQLFIPLSSNRDKHNAEHERRKALAAPTPFNRHYEFAVVECQDRSLSSPTGPKFRTWQLVGTDRKRETVYG